MDREDKDSIQYDYIDKLLQKIYGYTDEQILKDFEEAEKDDGSYPDFPEYPDEFDRIWEDIQAERAERMKSEPEEEAATVVEPPRKVRKIRWKRVAITGIAACLVTLSVCFVAVGKKSYFYRERERYNNVVFNNDSSIANVKDQEEAYLEIGNALNFKPLKLAYMPSGLVFKELEMNDRRAVMVFSYKDGLFYLVQTKDSTEISSNRRSDSTEFKCVTNKWLKQDIKIEKEEQKDNTNCYEAQFAYKDVYCWIYGNMEIEEFTKIIERVNY